MIAILKPGRPGDDPKNSRPISLLTVIYKLFERILLNRIQTQIKMALPKEQVGFRQRRICCEQALSLVTNIENGFQKCLKSSAVFLNLTSTYNAVWKQGLLLKLTKILKCKTMIQLINNMLSDRKFKVSLKAKVSGESKRDLSFPQYYSTYT